MRRIKLTQQMLKSIQEAFNEKIKNARFQEDKINFSYEFPKTIEETTEPKPVIYLSAATYLKITQYVLQCPTEIAWHGTVDRKDNHFFIKDVFLYPQKIAAATVQTDDTEYTNWAEKLPDTTFNSMRFQGHSHVNMSVSPSITDLNNWDEFLQNLLDNDFYIFMIMNKSQDMTLFIYDLSKNIIYEKKDIIFRVLLTKDSSIDEIADEINQYCEKPKAFGYSKYAHKDYLDYIYGEQDKALKKRKEIQEKIDLDMGTKTVKIKRHVVLLNRPGRDFEKAYPEFEGEKETVRQNGKDYECFVPYIPFIDEEIRCLRLDGWHVREMLVPEEYS